MSSIRKMKIPEEMVAPVVAIAKTVDVRLMMRWAMSDSWIARGHAVKEKNTEHFLEAVMVQITRTREIPLEFAGDLRAYSPFSRVVDALSTSTLLRLGEHLENFYAAIGSREEFLGALFLDTRDEIRGLALSFVKTEVDLSVGKQTAAMGSLMMELGDLSEILTKHLFKMKVDVEQHATLSKKLSTAEAKNASLLDELTKCRKGLAKGISGDRSAIEAKLAKAESEAGRLAKRCEELKAELKLVSSAHGKSTADYRELKEGFDSKVREAVSLGLSERIRPWLKPALILEKEMVSLSNSSDLYSVVEGLLARQAEVDEHYGNLKQLNEKMRKLKVLQARVSDATAESLKPVPGLKDAHDKLDAEIARISKTISKATKPRGPEYLAMVLGAINCADTETAFQALELLIESMKEADCFPKEEVRALSEAMVSRRKRYEDEVYYSSPEWAPAVHKDADSHMAIDLSRKTELLIDGHNLLFALRKLSGVTHTTGWTPDRREFFGLADRVGSLVYSAEDMKAIIFIDSPFYEKITHTDRVELIFSGGEGMHRADRTILETCYAHSALSEGAVLVVVTDDVDLGTKAREEGANHLLVEEFGAFLEAFEPRKVVHG